MLVLIGGDNHRLPEELIQAGGELRKGRLTRGLSVSETAQALAAASNAEPSTAARAQLTALQPRIKRSLH